MTVLLLLSGGLFASISKSVLLAVPGICIYLWQEREKRFVAPFLAAAVVLGAVALERSRGLEDFWITLSNTAHSRIQMTDDSLSVRWELIAVALDYAADCIVFGYGTEGTHERISEAADSTVHVYYLGLVVIAGLPAAMLLSWGMLLVVMGLWRAGEIPLGMFLAIHMAACLVMTVLLLSFQSLPLMLAGATLAQRSHAAIVRKPAWATHHTEQFC